MMQFRRAVALFLIVPVLLALSAASAEAQTEGIETQLDTVRHLAIQHNGRVKPFDSFARETVLFLTERYRYQGQDPVETVLRIAASPSEWMDAPLIAVGFRPLREKLGLTPRTGYVSYNELVSTRKLMRMLPAIVEKQERSENLSILETETWDVYQRFAVLSGLMQGSFALIPPPGEAHFSTPWISVSQEVSQTPASRKIQVDWKQLLVFVQEGNTKEIAATAVVLSDALRVHNELMQPPYPSERRLGLEVFYNRARPFRAARVLYFMAFLILLAGLIRQTRIGTIPGLSLMAVGFGVHAAGLIIRIILSQRPPVSNFYETMLWLPFVSVALAMVFERTTRTRYFALAAAFLASVVLLLADRLPLDPAIAPIVAVLRSNLWLTIHVLTIVASYGALTLACVLAHLAGFFYLRSGQHEALPGLSTALYRTLQVGVVLLAAGVMLGAVWGNASWGRYWGWDPKETWALITLLWFLAMLHGRYAGWLKTAGLAIGTIAGFFLLLVTYYGVSFYMVGLHSYAGASAKPVPLLLVIYLLAEIGFMAWLGGTAWRRRQ